MNLILSLKDKEFISTFLIEIQVLFSHEANFCPHNTYGSVNYCTDINLYDAICFKFISKPFQTPHLIPFPWTKTTKTLCLNPIIDKVSI